MLGLGCEKKITFKDVTTSTILTFLKNQQVNSTRDLNIFETLKKWKSELLLITLVSLLWCSQNRN